LPKAAEIAKVVRKAVKKSMFKKRYGDVFRAIPNGARSRSKRPHL